FVVWQDDRGSDSDIYGTPVSSLGVPLSTTGFPILVRAGDQIEPTIVSNNPTASHYLVAWTDERVASNWHIYANLVDNTGAVLRPGSSSTGVQLTTATGDQHAATAGFDTTRYVLAWEDDRSTPSQVYYTRVNESLVAASGTGTLVRADTSAQTLPAS